jgi:hypothetical protein
MGWDHRRPCSFFSALSCPEAWHGHTATYNAATRPRGGRTRTHEGSGSSCATRDPCPLSWHFLSVTQGSLLVPNSRTPQSLFSIDNHSSSIDYPPQLRIHLSGKITSPVTLKITSPFTLRVTLSFQIPS